MPSVRRVTSPPRGFGGGTGASLLAQCSRCQATSTARLTPRGASTYLPVEDGKHKGCGGKFRLFRTSEEAMGKTDYCGGFRMGTHALERQREMKVSDVELADCLRNPENIYGQSGYGKDAVMFQKGRLSVVVDRKAKFCITVLWRTTETYERGKS